MTRPAETAPEEKKILILDGMWNKTLAAVRSLGKRGFHLTVGEWTRFATALFSKYCSKKVIYPSPISVPDEFISWLLHEIKSNRYEMVLPMELQTQMLLIKHREEIEQHTRLPFGDYESISNIENKAWLMKFALSNNISCPKTFFPENPVTAETLAGSLDYPVVIKPRRSSGSRGILYVKKPSGFIDAYHRVHNDFPCPIVQEYIPNGGAFGVGALFNYDSEPRAAFVYKRLREYPVTGGPSTLRKSTNNKEIEKIALSLLKSLKWTGIAMVEFRVDARDGSPKLMEINPRFWGSLQLAILSGVDFPYLLYKLAVNGDVDPNNNYKLGVKSRWLIPGDIMHFINNPERFRLSPSFFSFDAKDDIISVDDPMPTLGRISSLIPLMYNRDMKKILNR